jgi:uncharacterized ParB-like nuclease family protein
MKDLRARADFENARLQAFLKDAAQVLRPRSSHLLSFDEVRSAARMEGQSYRGLQEVPVNAIRGSVGRVNDFDASFLPVRPHLRKRWAQIDAAMRRGEAVPPVELYRLGDAYFVKDGHHRVSVAKQLGREKIEARVIEVRTRVPLTADMDPAQLLKAREYLDFLERTQLDRVRPEASIEVSQLGRYDRIYEHILGHRYFLGLEQGREVPVPEAAASWYDRVYKPIADLFKEYGILEHFPGRTEADLYLWVTARWLELSKAGAKAGPAEAIADILFETEGTPGPSPDLLLLVRTWLGPPRRFVELSGKLLRLPIRQLARAGKKRTGQP